MKALSELSEEELGALLFAQINSQWQKVAMVIAKATRGYILSDEVSRKLASDSNNSSPSSTADPNLAKIDRLVASLIASRKVESAGDVTRWRFSEIRLRNERT